MLGLSAGTIQQYSSRRPSRLPAPISAPRCTLRWRTADVEQWIKARQQAWVQLELPLEESK